MGTDDSATATAAVPAAADAETVAVRRRQSGGIDTREEKRMKNRE